jgi:hypothetical protein
VFEGEVKVCKSWKNKFREKGKKEEKTC